MEEGAHIIELVGAIFGLLLIAAATLAVTKRVKVPFTVALVLVGVGIAQLAPLGLEFMAPVLNLQISPEVVFFVFLPTLVFESAYNLDARALRENLYPVLILAIPGLLISTVIIGGIMVWVTPMEWPAALLMGSILSATDPVAVISLFKSLGAPKRLTVLVEGESLFNDATAIVASKIILGVILAGVFTSQTVVSGVISFFVVFFGGLVVGWAAAVVIGLILGRVEGDPFIEISLTTILAYFSFLVAEEYLHLSGVMATVAAGMVIGGWGKTKISHNITHHLEYFWEYLAWVANALIFLMVGLRIDLNALVDSLPLILAVLLAMLVSRAAVIFGLVPVVGRLPGADPIDHRYQTVMFWGGLRGGIALAIALSLPEIEGRDTIVALVAGAVLFTLIVQGLTIEPLMKRFGLDIPPLSDRLARMEGVLSAKRRARDQIPNLQRGGLFTPRIAQEAQQRCDEDIQKLRDELDATRRRELDLDDDRRLLYLRSFGEEKTLYYEMFTQGHLTERAYRDLAHSVELQTEGIRHQGSLPGHTLHPPSGERLEVIVLRSLDRVIGLRSAVEQLRAGRTARDYEEAWARSRGSDRVLQDLEELREAGATREDVIEEVRAFYQYWHERARSRMDQTAEQFPEFVGSMQERLAERLLLHAEHEAIEEKAHAGIIPDGVAEQMLEDLAAELRQLRTSAVGKLQIDPSELLRKVPFFQFMPPEEFERVAASLRPRTAPAGEAIIRQGEAGDAMYLVARGVIRVSVDADGEKVDVATLIAGDFFGEMALLHEGDRRTATCRAVTPCALYELKKADLDDLRGRYEVIQDALAEADRARRKELQEKT